MTRNAKDLIGTAFVVTDWTESFALDCDTDADNAIADVLGTLINELIKKGVLHGSASA